ncbi:proton-coupled amino acid transporter-like protein pathetic isoform X2 [Lycorma delicatula]|uniref:proton-coupled amino acid transporter-like protein pathetic isoform X2 n=1 Tax=Lycorma delicatula TaxID=130591 RepID=UPI003F50DDCD
METPQSYFLSWMKQRCQHHKNRKIKKKILKVKMTMILTHIGMSYTQLRKDFETLIHLLKASLGTGILAMPMAFKSAGLWTGLIGSIVIGIICTYCVSLFVNSAYILCKRNKIPAIGFRKIAELAFLEGPVCLKKFSKFAGYVINAGLVLEMLGVCCAYVLFVAKSLKQVIEYYYNVNLHVQIYMIIIVPPLIGMNLLKNLKHLTPLSMISNIFFIFGVCVTYYYILDDLPSVSERPAFSSFAELPVFFGTTIFALEGIGVVMPLENNMKTPRHFNHCPGVLFIGMTILIILYVITGFFGYLKYGEHTAPSITLNIPIDSMLGQILKVIVMMAVFFTYALLFYVAMDLLGILNGRIFKSHRVIFENLSRIVIILGTVLVAALFPNLGPFLSLIGAFSLSIVGLIFPPIIDSLVYWKTESYKTRRIWKNAFLLLCGLIGLFTGTVTSLREFTFSSEES